jgi:hypothetical protein
MPADRPAAAAVATTLPSGHSVFPLATEPWAGFHRHALLRRFTAVRGGGWMATASRLLVRAVSYDIGSPVD